MIASTTSDDENRYVITVAVASPANPGPAVGAWMVRLGTKTRVQVVADLGVVSTHRACLLTIAEALKAPRAHRHPIVVRCNQKAAVQALKRVGDNLVLNPGNEGLDEVLAMRVRWQEEDARRKAAARPAWLGQRYVPSRLRRKGGVAR